MARGTIFWKASPATFSGNRETHSGEPVVSAASIVWSFIQVNRPVRVTRQRTNGCPFQPTLCKNGDSMNDTHVISSPNLPRPLVGVSSWSKRIQAEIASVAPYPSSVLICGPTGTGKEVIAHSIHNQSDRSDKPFVPVNCAAVAPSLFESQMFGHLKGAFTGASVAAQGCFRAAEGGTLFLDEVGEMPLDLQAKLLRVLQEGMVVPVGGQEQVRIDVRVIAATNRDLIQEIADGRFRQDLFYRLAVVSLNTIPLTERTDDINIISQFLISRLCRDGRMPFKPLSPSAEARLQAHDWPGNVRELQNVLERALLLSRGAMIQAGDIVFDEAPSESESYAPRLEATEPLQSVLSSWMKENDRWPTMKELERWHIKMTLEYTNCNQSEAARVLEMHRGSLHRRIKEYGLDVSSSRRGRPSHSGYAARPSQPR